MEYIHHELSISVTDERIKTFKTSKKRTENSQKLKLKKIYTLYSKIIQGINSMGRKNYWNHWAVYCTNLEILYFAIIVNLTGEYLGSTDLSKISSRILGSYVFSMGLSPTQKSLSEFKNEQIEMISESLSCTKLFMWLNWFADCFKENTLSLNVCGMLWSSLTVLTPEFDQPGPERQRCFSILTQ